jgi:hypothetical protein
LFHVLVSFWFTVLEEVLMMDGDIRWEMAELRGQIAELGSAIRQLRQAGMDSAAAQLLITRRRAELEDLMAGTRHRPESEAPRPT